MDEEILTEIITLYNKNFSDTTKNKYLYTIRRILDFINYDYDNFYNLEEVNNKLYNYYSYLNYKFSIRVIVEMLGCRLDEYEDIYELWLLIKKSVLKHKEE